MKGISILMAAGSLFLASSVGIAAQTVTSMDSNWVCKTNASRAHDKAQKAADKSMEKQYTSASAAFKAASDNCRNCTKIKCWVKRAW